MTDAKLEFLCNKSDVYLICMRKIGKVKGSECNKFWDHSFSTCVKFSKKLIFLTL